MSGRGNGRKGRTRKIETSAYSSPVSSRVGMKPPVSVPQYGERLKEEFSPTDTCAASLAQRESTSPDHTQPP